MKIINISKNTVIIANCKIANTFFSRMKGLSGRIYLPDQSGLLIYPCKSIHTFFMKFPIDVVFLNKQKHVLHIIGNLKPWHTSPVIRNAYYTLELASGIAHSCIGVNDKILFKY